MSSHVMHAPARYLVLIETGGSVLARLFDAAHRHVGDFDASSEEVAVMTTGLTPQQGAQGREWEPTLTGHNAGERAAAQVYLLDI